MQTKKEELEMDMEQWTGSKLAKENIRAVCLFNLYAEYIMWKDEAQAGIKMARGNINNLRYTDDTTLMAESKEERASWWKWKRRVKSWLKT